MKQFPEGEKYSRNKVESYIEQKWNNSATNFTNLLADTSIYNVLKNQQQYIDNATEKLTPEAEDKIRQQKGVSAAFDQLEEVRKKYCGTDKWLKAPNGKDTNLTERQWIQVRTPNFKEWFGDWENDPQNASKVVDKNGEPMVVYHGSRTAGFSKFSEFDGEKQSNAPYGSFWFSASEYVARLYSGTSKLVENYVDLSEISEDYDSEYGLPYEDLGYEPANYACFLNIRQPYYQDFEGQNWSGDIKGAYTLEAKNEFGEWEQVYNNHGGQLFNTKEEAEERAKARGDNEYEIREDGWLGFDTNSEVDNAMNDGYFDGAILKNVDDQGGRDYADVANDYVIFDPNQAKSAVDNTGDFGVGDDIRYQTMSLSEEQMNYIELKKNIVLNYSDESRYTNAETPSKNVFIFTEHYENYKKGIYSKHQRIVYEKELRAAEVFGNEGFRVFVLPEKLILAEKEYNGKIPDALLNGYLVEFKELETTKAGQFQIELGRAAEKADILYLDSPVDILESKSGGQSLKNAINGKIQSSERNYEDKIIVTSVRGENPTFYIVKNGALKEAPLARLRLEPQPNSNMERLNNIVKNEVIKAQQSATPLNQTIQGRTEPALIKSSFRFDTTNGKYFISGDVYNEIVEVMRSSFPIVNNTVETEVRKTATLATAFLTSLSDDTQDALVRKSATATGGKFLTGGNENLLRLFFNMNELKDTKGVNEYTKGLSLSQSAKIILGINSDESTIRHEGTHIIWWADSGFRERAQTEFKKYFEQDNDGKEIRAVVEANLDRFGGYNADQVINALKNLTREDYDSFQLKKLLPAWAKCTWKTRIRLSTVKGLEVSLNGWLIS